MGNLEAPYCLFDGRIFLAHVAVGFDDYALVHQVGPPDMHALLTSGIQTGASILSDKVARELCDGGKDEEHQPTAVRGGIYNGVGIANGVAGRTNFEYFLPASRPHNRNGFDGNECRVVSTVFGLRHG